MKFLKSNINLVMICSGILGYAMVLIIFFYDVFSIKGSLIDHSTGNSDDFLNRHPLYLLWLAIMLVQGVLWFILIFPATEIIIKLQKELKPEHNIWKSLITILIVFGLFMLFSSISFFQYLQLPDSSYNHHSYKLPLFTLIGRLVAIYFLFGVVLVGRSSSNFSLAENFSVVHYKRLRNQMDVLLNFTGIVLSLGVITSILFNKAINAEPTHSLFPPEFVITFGLMNTLVIVIFYLPSYLVMQDYGRELVEHSYPIEGADKETLAEKLIKQNELTKHINLSLNIPDTLKKTAVIFSPLLSSLMPRFFDMFGQ